MIATTANFDNFQLAFQNFNRGQKAHALQTIRVQIVGLIVRCQYQHHAFVREQLQQAAQDHGVGDIAHMKLVETQETQLPCNLV